jgi:hypothetical protein
LHTGVARQLIERVGPERVCDIGLVNPPVWATADPGIDGVALAALLQLLQQIVESPIEDRTRGCAAENASQRSLEQIA